ncbi:MAG: protein kinase [Gemmatimonadaceae bacterium]|nr:protein kinase [Gemmatimonadaceae bacterium]
MTRDERTVSSPASDARLRAALADRYELQRELGAGGMATVYLARDVRHAREVAIKVLHPELAAVLGAERFLSEIRTTASLQHPHILPLFDSGEAAGQLFFVMPYVEGETLRHRLERERQLRIPDAITLAREVADALQYAHDRGVIHRDIKPENILLQGGHALVADFGIALAVTNAGGTRMTQTGLSLGTPQYMAPEQAMGERNVDARADLYALGAVTYEMIAGEPPFTGPTSQAIVAKVLSGDPAPLDSLRRNVPAHVADAVHVALEKLPADRVASAAEFRATLLGEAPRARPSRAARGGPPAVGTRWIWPALAAVSTVIAIGLGVDRMRRTDAPAAREASSVFQIGLADSARIAGVAGGWKVAISPDGQYLAAVLLVGSGTQRSLYLRRSDDLEFRRVPGTNGATWPTFSPDGRQIAYYAGEVLFTIAVDGGTPIEVARTSIGASTWTDDGRLLFQVDTVLAIATPGRAMQRIVPTLNGRAVGVNYPSALPGGRYALINFIEGSGVVRRLDAQRVGVLEIASGVIQPLDLPGSNPRYASGYVLFGRRDGLYAVSFDIRSRRAGGAPVRIVDRVAYGGGGQFSYGVTDHGTLMYQPALTGAVTVAPDALVRYDLSGGRATTLTDAGGVFRDMRISPDGQRAIVRRDASPDLGNLSIYEFATNTFTRLTDDSASFRGEWSADGRRVVHLRRFGVDSVLVISRAWDRSGPDSTLLRTNFDAGAAGKGFGFQYLSLARTNSRVAVRIGGTSFNPDIYMSTLADLRVRRPLAIAATAARELNPAMSPDGRWVAYQSDESGVNEIYVLDTDGRGPRLRVSEHGGVEPVWYPDGRRLLFRASRNFARATLSFAPLAVTARDSLAPDPFYRTEGTFSYDLFPSGDAVLVTTSNSAGGVGDDLHIRVLTNWTARVKSEGAAR